MSRKGTALKVGKGSSPSTGGSAILLSVVQKDNSAAVLSLFGDVTVGTKFLFPKLSSGPGVVGTSPIHQKVSFGLEDGKRFNCQDVENGKTSWLYFDTPVILLER